jgi:GTP-binding protein YchF
MLKIGIIGLPQTGKKELFKLLIGSVSSSHTLVPDKINLGVAQIKDLRFDFLVNLYKSKKTTRAKVDVALLPKIEKDTITKGDIFKDLSNMDALCHVVRAFKNDSVYHVKGTIDPQRDIREVNSELIMHDLIFIEKRLQRIKEMSTRVKDEASAKESLILLKLTEQLNKELPLRLLQLESQDLKILSGYPLLTLKQMIVVLNISEEDLKSENLLTQFEEKFSEQKVFFMQACLKIETEIASLGSESEKKEFLAALGIREPAIDCLTRLCVKALGRISFFTAGPQEIRQWTISYGSSALEAAGAIHSDLERGFIRAEVMHYADLEEIGCEDKLKIAGKYYSNGKEYKIEDGDIIFIRFSV